MQRVFQKCKNKKNLKNAYLQYNRRCKELKILTSMNNAAPEKRNIINKCEIMYIINNKKYICTCFTNAQEASLSVLLIDFQLDISMGGYLSKVKKQKNNSNK